MRTLRAKAIGLLSGVAIVGVVVTSAMSAPRVPSSPDASDLAAASASTVQLARSDDGDGLRIVQANVKAGMSGAATAADVAKVFAEDPDFVTFNEMSGRSDAVIAPPGYAFHRGSGAYKGATPVVWNMSRWTAISSGTYMISNREGKSATQKIHWGIRYANWVTARNNASGRVVSVVSTHFAPMTKYTQGLREPSYRRLAALMATLGRSGPVYAGGDFNVHFRSKDYPRALVDSLGLTTSFDLTGLSPATHRSGAIIDYVYFYNRSGEPVTRQQTTTLNSDHKMLSVDVGTVVPVVPRYAPAVTTSDPAVDGRKSARLLIDVINHAPPGAVLHLNTRRFDIRAVFWAIKRAVARGTHVQVITGHRRATAMDVKLRRLLGTNLARKSWTRRQPNWSGYNLSASSLLASASGDTTAVRLDLSLALVRTSFTRRVRATLRTDLPSYDRLFVECFRAVGRPIG